MALQVQVVLAEQKVHQEQVVVQVHQVLQVLAEQTVHQEHRVQVEQVVLMEVI
jgi:hypothetical protein